MQIITSPITNKELKDLASKMFGDLVKAVVDIEKNLLTIDAELHADLEQFLLQKGSRQTDLWGINLHPENFNTDTFIEFDSMINVRPNQNNPSRSVLDHLVRNQIKNIVISKITA